MTHILVIAGNRKEAEQWVEKNTIHSRPSGDMYHTYHQYIIVDDIDDLRGIPRNPKGRFIGTWKDRSDILDIIKELKMSTDGFNDKLADAWEQVIGYKNIHSTVSYGWQNGNILEAPYIEFGNTKIIPLKSGITVE